MKVQQNDQFEMNEVYEDQNKQQSEETSLISNARTQFVRKVYSILMIQLLFTSLVVVLRFNIPAFAVFQDNHIQLFFASFFIGLVILIVLCCFSSISKSFPTNMILLGIFTLTESWMVSSICGFYDASAVLQAALATAGATCGLTLFAWKTKYDFTKWAHFFYGFMFCFFFMLTWVILLDLLFITQSTFLEMVYSIVFAVIYIIYILIDTQLIMGGRSVEFSLDNYVLGAVFLYVDIIGLFLKLLRIFGSR